MGDGAKRRAGLRGLNLLWAVPLAFAIGYLPAALARFERCGIHDCLGEAVGFASPLAPNALGAATLGALAMFGALTIVPWLRPVGLRVAISLIVAVLIFVYYVWAVLFA